VLPGIENTETLPGSDTVHNTVGICYRIYH